MNLPEKYLNSMKDMLKDDFDDYQKIIVMQDNIIISIDDIADIKSDIFNRII